LAHLEPLHPVDELDRRTDHEIGRTVESASQHHRFASACRPPAGGACRHGLHEGYALMVAEPLRQCRQQRSAGWILRVRSGHSGDGHRLQRRVTGDRDRQDDADGADRQHQRGDQHPPRRAFLVLHRAYTPGVVTYRPGGGVSTLGDVGEFGVIEGLIRGRRQPGAVAVGPGDDAAVLSAADGRVVVSTDMLVENRHFRLDWSTPHDVGRKAVAQNAADIEAMGARATAFVVGFGAPPETPTAQVSALADGMWDEAGRIGAGIVGGDLVSSPQWVVSITVLGDLDGRAPVLRSGARPGARIAVAGQLGQSAAGYTLWHNGIEGFDDLRNRHVVPQPPYGQGRAAADADAQAMIDISDGLVGDLRHVAQASGVTVDLSTEALRGDREALLGAAEAAGVDAWTWVLGGGEDHALVAAFTGPAPAGWRVIGQVLDGPARVLVDGAEWRGYAGWESFGR
jgi:thiamine-monophosphate kinase